MTGDDMFKSFRVLLDEAVPSVTADEAMARSRHRDAKVRGRSLVGPRRLLGAGLALALTAGVIGAVAATSAPSDRIAGQHLPTRTRSVLRQGWIISSLAGPRFGFDHTGPIIVTGHHGLVSNAHSIIEFSAANATNAHVLPGWAERFGRPLSMVVVDSRLYVLNGKKNLLAELSLGTGSLIRSFRGPFRSAGAMAYASGHLWLANTGPDTSSVVELNPATGRVVRRLRSLRYGFSDPSAMCVAGTNLWVADTGGPALTELDARTGQLVRIVPSRRVAPAGSYDIQAPISIACERGHLWIVNYYEGDSIAEFSARSGDLLRLIPAARLGVRTPLQVAAENGHLWLAAAAPAPGPGSVVEINPATGAVERRFSAAATGVRLLPESIAVSNGNHVFVSLGSDSITEIHRR